MYVTTYFNICYMLLIVVAAQGHRRVTVNATGCGFDSHSRKYLIFSFPLATELAMPPEFS